MRRFWTKPGLILGLILTGGAVAAALISLVWTPWSPVALSVRDRLKAPSGAHWLGTDQLGRDIASMLMTGAQTSLTVALASVLVGALIGVPLGLSAAARGPGHATDIIVTRFNDLVFAFPALVSAILISATLGPGPANAALAIGIFNVPVFARISRAGAMAIWPLDYIRAARVAGKGAVRISLEHVLPNIASLLIVQATIQFSVGILMEAALSYVGLGARPPTPSWGRMLAESQTMAAMAPHVAIFPGLAIVVTVLGLNLLGDGLRDALDPRLRGRP